MTTGKLPGVEIPREFWPRPENSDGFPTGFLSENPARIWYTIRQADWQSDWLFCLVIMPGPVGWACVVGQASDSPSPTIGPNCEDIWAEGFHWLRKLGCPVVQFLGENPENILPPSGFPNFPIPKEFVEVAEFCDLGWKKEAHHRFEPPNPDLSWIRSTAGECGELAVRTMSGSLDCPPLSPYRSDQCAWDSLIQIHGAQKSCWVLLWKNCPAGVLLGRAPRWDASNPSPPQTDLCGEISYFGLIPEMRGNHLGTQFLAKFLMELVPEGARMVTMVDRGNTPAWKTYHSVGFTKFRSSPLFLATL